MKNNRKNTGFKLLYNQLWLVDTDKICKINPQAKLDQRTYAINDGDIMRDKVAVLMPENVIEKRSTVKEVVPSLERQVPAILKPISLVTSKDIKDITKINASISLFNDWDELVKKATSCVRCSLSASRKNVVIERGNRQAKWMFIGEVPDESEDLYGVPFAGASGELLDKMIRAMRLNPEEDVYICDVVKCSPPLNRNPEDEELVACSNYLFSQIKLVKPQIIIALGKFASQMLLGLDSVVNKLRGKIHSFETIPVIVTYHPSYLLRNVWAKKEAWEDLKLALLVFEKNNENKD